jgi:hypothetical protein
MRLLPLIAMLSFMPLAVPAAHAQTAAAVPEDRIGTSKPPPGVAEDASTTAFIDAAMRALAAGRIPEASEDIERAESRALDRDVAPSKAGDASKQKLVLTLSKARQSLTAGDRLGTITLLQQAAEIAKEPAQAPAEPAQ